MPYSADYIHQSKLANAVRRLYRIGRRDTGGGHGIEMAGGSLATGLGSFAKRQLQHNKVSEAAAKVPINGKYTEKGREEMVNTVQRNADDIAFSKQLMQEGAMMDAVQKQQQPALGLGASDLRYFGGRG